MSASPSGDCCLTIVTRYFHPDVAGSAIRLTELATGLASRGCDVSVLTTQPSYASLDRGRTKRSKTETYRGVDVRRVWATRLNKNRTLLCRAINELSFFLSAMVALVIADEDRCLFTTNPPFLPVLGGIVSAVRGTEYVLLIHDLHPEMAARFGFLSKRNPVFWFWEWCNAQAYSRAERVVVLDESMADTVRSKYGSEVDVTVIHNWEDGDAIEPRAKADNEFAREHRLVDGTVVLYSGNIGEMHDLKSLVLAMAEFRVSNSDLRAVIIGEGSAKPELEALASDRRLTNVTFLPYQPRERLPESLTCGDIALVTVDEGADGVCVSGKFYTALASGLAILAVTEPGSTIERVVEETNCGRCVRPNSPSELADALRELHDEADLDAMGERARETFERRFTREDAIDQFHELVATR